MSDREGTWLGLRKRAKPLVQAGVLLGLGLGGFFDGIVIHQILQWHHMLSSHHDPSIANDLRLNMMADGFFHVATYIFTVLGVVLLWRAWRRPAVPRSGRTLFGSVISGWGLFNLGEGIVNHHLLGIHHVWPAGPGSVLLWDGAFLVWGILFVIGGYAIVRGDEAVSVAPEVETEPT
ncbi:DUF2243 domain-containing protein [Haladaptatus pallidirubidus]|uniref:DUF2243 domain-containing protein n=1 Tax=Haladaptatus pallidirubidus TaxID=1008152 RepID=A0AAV3UCF6_9EURY|nr:DUF2243 domain-containing protein [Haladaptatus pallidirubidus]